jgi:hypothetical protein
VADDVVAVVHPQPDLLQVVLALGAAGSLPDLLNGRQEQSDEDGDDGDDDQQLDQGKPRPSDSARDVPSHEKPSQETEERKRTIAR